MVDFPTDVSATDPSDLLGANATDPAKVSISATGRTLIGGANAAAMRGTLGLGTAATAATGDFDAAGAAATAEGAAIIAASNDATSKANTAQANAIAAAALDATTKANTAQSTAISTAAGDATAKDNALKTLMIATSTRATRTVSGDATITTADFYVRYTGTGGHTLTIPAANIAGAGFTPQLFFRNVGTAAVTITDGVSYVSLLPGQKALFMSDGVSTWDVN